MIAETGAAIKSIKLAMDMAKGIAALKSETEINQAVIDIQRALLEAQTAALDDKQLISRLVDEKSALEKQLADLDSWATEKKRYRLTESEVGTFTYELRQEFANGEAHHRLCVTCFENQRKSILHGLSKITCHTCNKSIRIERIKPYNHSTSGYF